MKKGIIHKLQWGDFKVTGASKYGIAGKWTSGILKGKEALIDKAIFKENKSSSSNGSRISTSQVEDAGSTPVEDATPSEIV